MTPTEVYDDLAFILKQRSSPTVVLIASDNDTAKRELMALITAGIEPDMPAAVRDLGGSTVEPLLDAIRRAAAPEVNSVPPGQGLLHLTGLERSATPRQLIISQLNFERENLFRSFPFNLILWTSTEFADQLRADAQDLWDWLAYVYRL